MSDKKIFDEVRQCQQLARDLPKTISSDALLGQGKQLFIVHEGHQYQLRITKLRKLILTK